MSSVLIKFIAMPVVLNYQKSQLLSLGNAITWRDTLALRGAYCSCMSGETHLKRYIFPDASGRDMIASKLSQIPFAIDFLSNNTRFCPVGGNCMAGFLFFHINHRLIQYYSIQYWLITINETGMLPVMKLSHNSNISVSWLSKFYRVKKKFYKKSMSIQQRRKKIRKKKKKKDYIIIMKEMTVDVHP